MVDGLGAHVQSTDRDRAKRPAVAGLGRRVAINGVALRTNLHLDTTERCTTVEAGIELVGDGGVLVTGTHDNAYLEDDHYTLTGLDTLEVTVPARDATTSWHLVGTSRACTIDVTTGGCRV